MQRVCAGAATMCSECVQVQRLCACEYAASVCRCSDYVHVSRAVMGSVEWAYAANVAYSNIR